jgi:hypothetical protein
MKIVNIGDFWTANLVDGLHLVEIVQTWVRYEHTMTDEDREYWKGMGYTPEETPKTVWEVEDSGWLYRSWRGGMQDVMRDPNMMLEVIYRDEDGFNVYEKISPNDLVERVPGPGDEPEPWTKDEPTKISGKVLGGVALGALLFWDELALIFLATR